MPPPAVLRVLRLYDMLIALTIPLSGALLVAFAPRDHYLFDATSYITVFGSLLLTFLYTT